MSWHMLLSQKHPPPSHDGLSVNKSQGRGWSTHPVGLHLHPSPSHESVATNVEALPLLELGQNEGRAHFFVSHRSVVF